MQVSIAQRITRCNSALKIGYKRLEIGSAFWGFPAFNLSPHVPAIGLVLGGGSPSKSLPFYVHYPECHSGTLVFPSLSCFCQWSGNILASRL